VNQTRCHRGSPWTRLEIERHPGSAAVKPLWAGFWRSGRGTANRELHPDLCRGPSNVGHSLASDLLSVGHSLAFGFLGGHSGVGLRLANGHSGGSNQKPVDACMPGIT
jgi:hypothetical protein